MNLAKQHHLHHHLYPTYTPTHPPTCTISSMRLRNSGLKWRRTTSITAARASGPLPCSSRMLAPRLEVMMQTLGGGGGGD